MMILIMYLGKCWLRSGDIGMWTIKGQLVIIDRKKNMFKLSQGEYIVVEKIEGILSNARLVSQIFVHGDSTQDKLVAAVVPDEEAVMVWLKSNKEGGGGVEGREQMKVRLLVLVFFMALS